MRTLSPSSDEPPGLKVIAAALQTYIRNWVNLHPYWTFGGAGLFGLILIGQILSPSSGQAIRTVIDQDKAISQQISQRVGVLDTYWNGSSLVAEMSNRMDAIDLTGCPQDFQFAYKRHVAAWAAVARVKGGNEGLNGAIKGFFTGGLSIFPAWSELDLAMSEVSESWKQVQRAAIAHGVSP